MENGAGLTLRPSIHASIHASVHDDVPADVSSSSSAERGGGDSESPSGGGGSVHANDEVEAPPPAGADGLDNNDGDDEREIKNAMIALPHSTHSLLFTEPILSLPFAFGVAVLTMTCSTLSFALIDALWSGSPGNEFNIPSNVLFVVSGAQYLAIFIVMLMEEEIPTGLYLLRMIPRKTFKGKFPDKSYRRFVCSSLLRICMGYLFLTNVFVVLIQATRVLEIFYDVMALQFVQQLDDISFHLAKMDMLGKAIFRATTTKSYRAEFQKQKIGKKTSVFLKVIYFLNLCVLLALMAIVSTRQKRGYYQCKSITVAFGNAVWEGAVVKTPSGKFEDDWTLFYSYFNGVYIQDGEHHGRPKYREVRKYNNTLYETTIAAEIKFCREEGAWIFTHEKITKSRDSEESGCGSWLLRSPESIEFDVLAMDGDWDAWIGTVDKTLVSVGCNECYKELDCNLKGQCVNHECKCHNGNGIQYLGKHCEVKLKDSCQNITGEVYNDTWSVAYMPPSNASKLTETLIQQYSRPVYSHIEGNLSLIYSGSRWFGVYIVTSKDAHLKEWILRHTAEYHAFWDQIFSKDTLFVSDPTTSSTPVGVDFYYIGEQGDQYGVFGELVPLQLHNQTGRGLYRCGDSYSTSRNIQNALDRRLRLERVFTQHQLRKLGG